MINKNLTTNLTHLTICNYSNFQDTVTNKKPQSNQSPTIYNKGNKVINNKDIPNFDLFWMKYPNKKSKKKARQIWINKKLENSYNDIMNGLNRYILSDNWKSDGGAYIPHPTTFLNQERWLDELNDNIVKSDEDIREINEKKQNRRFQEEWKKSSQNIANSQDIKSILGNWKKQRI